MKPTLHYITASDVNCQSKSPHYPHCFHCRHTDKLGACAWPYNADEEIEAGRVRPWRPEVLDEAWLVGTRGGSEKSFRIYPARIVSDEEAEV